MSFEASKTQTSAPQSKEDKYIVYTFPRKEDSNHNNSNETMPTYKRHFSAAGFDTGLEHFNNPPIRQPTRRRSEPVLTRLTQEPPREDAFKRQRLSTYFAECYANSSFEELNQQKHFAPQPLSKSLSFLSKKLHSFQECVTHFLTKFHTLQKSSPSKAQQDLHMQANESTDTQKQYVVSRMSPYKLHNKYNNNNT